MTRKNPHTALWVSQCLFHAASPDLSLKNYSLPLYMYNFLCNSLRALVISFMGYGGLNRALYQMLCEWNVNNSANFFCP